MNATNSNTEVVVSRGSSIFDRVLVGVDGSPESLEAARQAARLVEVGGRLTLLAAYDIASALIGGTGVGVPPYYDEEAQRERAEAAVRGARERLPGQLVTLEKTVRGSSWEELLREAERERNDLVAVGSHGLRRAVGILVGSTATEIIHKAACSALVAREAGREFPSKLVVGVDGSPESAAAYSVARALATRFDATLRAVVARGSGSVDARLVATIVDGYEEVPEEPVPALVGAAAGSDLVVIGNRGLHGFKSLGSVSERVAHQAGCSVLIVRRPGDGFSSL